MTSSMTATTRTIAAAAFVALLGTPAVAQQSYGSASSVAATLGATASPPAAQGAYPAARPAPAYGMPFVADDDLVTGSIAPRRTPRRPHR